MRRRRRRRRPDRGDPRQGRRVSRSSVGGREARREVRELVRVLVLNPEPGHARVGRVQVGLVVVVVVFLVPSGRRLFRRGAAFGAVVVVDVAAVEGVVGIAAVGGDTVADVVGVAAAAFTLDLHV